MQACQRFWHSRYCGLTGVLQRNVCPPDGLFVWVSLILLKYLKCSLFMGISTHYQLLAGGGQLQPSKCEPLPMNSWHERGGGRQGGERGACVCIVPLQGSRCCGPHSGEDPGCMAGSGGGRQGRGHHKLQAQDTPGSDNAFLSKLVYVLPRGKVAQGCVGTDLWASAW